MPIRTPIDGDAGANDLQGSSGADLVYGYDPAAVPVDGIAATRVGTGFDQPLFVASAPGDPGHLYVVEKGGTIRVLDPATGAVADQPFLNVSGEIATEGEQGLLGLAFAPDFVQTGRFYVNLVNRQGDTEIRAYRTLAGDPTQVDPASARVVLAVDQPDGFTNHKGGWLGFGPDGFLYAALGDGGGAGDPLGNAQNPGSLLGKMLRLDVAGTDGGGDRIPADNPFVGTGGAPEVWALGLRNPWRAGFDRGLGDLWIADVGQSRWEEVDRGAPGANYGWNLFEGPEPFASGTPAVEPLTPPLYAYGRDAGGTVIGGTVYRGSAEALHGAYVFADFISGRLWSLRVEDGAPVVTERTGQVAVDRGSLDSPVSFGEDARGDLYLVDFEGDVFRLLPLGTPPDEGDRLTVGAGDDLVFGGAGGDSVLGGDGADKLFGQSGADRLDGGPGADTVFGGQGADIAYGNEAADVIHGGPEGDRLFGGRNADRLFGNRGDDTLSGNRGYDTLSGGEGADRFVFADAAGAEYGTDTVTDFNVAEGDRLVIPGGAAWSVRQDGADALIALEGGAAVRLSGVAADAVDATWFLAA